MIIQPNLLQAFKNTDHSMCFLLSKGTADVLCSSAKLQAGEKPLKASRGLHSAREQMKVRGATPRRGLEPAREGEDKPNGSSEASARTPAHFAGICAKTQLAPRV